VLAVAYLVYKFGPTLGYTFWSGGDFPDISFRFPRGLGKIAATIPYLAATFFGVFFQMWNRKRQAARRKEMEAGLEREGPIRRAEGVAVRVGKKLGQSYEADVYLTRAALYVFDRAKKRDPMRMATRRSEGTAFITDAALEPGDAGSTPTVLVQLGGTIGWPLALSAPDAVAWWVDIRKTLGKSTDVDQEMLSRGSATAGADSDVGREPSARWPDAPSARQ
jgi:hypothetical protein